ncbi:MAG: hypothetical protein PHV18_06685 [Lachnospiraceae bacterium]|nr:hypothetical protein [Lachnospiraceae bacterium]
MRKLIVAGSTVVMMAAMGMTAFAANTVSAPSAGSGSYGYCSYIDDDGNGICDTCANERAHCGHEGHAGACSDSDYRDDRYGNDCGETHRRGCGHSSEGRRGHHGGCR